MVNEESRKYFNRAYAASSSSLTFYALRRTTHLQPIRECSQLDQIDEIIDYLKTTSVETLAKCYSNRNMNCILLNWAPTIEPSGTIGAFLNRSAEEIYKSDSAPVMDALFSFTSQVFQ